MKRFVILIVLCFPLIVSAQFRVYYQYHQPGWWHGRWYPSGYYYWNGHCWYLKGYGAFNGYDSAPAKPEAKLTAEEITKLKELIKKLGDK